MIKTIIIFNLCFITFTQAGLIDAVKKFLTEEYYMSESEESSEESAVVEEEPQEKLEQSTIIEEESSSLTSSTLQMCDETINKYLENIIKQAHEKTENLLPKIINEHSNPIFWPVILKAALKKQALNNKDFLWLLNKNNKYRDEILKIIFSLNEDFSYLFSEVDILKEHYFSDSVLNRMNANSYNEKQNLLVYLIENSNIDLFKQVLDKFKSLFDAVDKVQCATRRELVNNKYEEVSYTILQWLLRKEQIYVKTSAYAYSKSGNYVLAAKVIIDYLIKNNISTNNPDFKLLATTLFQEKDLSLEEFNKLKFD